MKSSHALLYGGFAFGVTFAACAAIAAPDNVGDQSLRVIRLADASDQPAWAAPAKMNPDYKADGSDAAPSPPDTSAASSDAQPAATTADADTPPPPTGGTATTSYYGGQESPANPPWAAEATMNSDANPSTSAAPSDAAATPPEAQPATAEADTPPPPTGGTATTSYYGGEAAPSNPAWAAEATMNSDYKAGAAAPTAAATSTPAPASGPTPTWAAEATMNPDYKKGEMPPAATTTAAAPAASDSSNGTCATSVASEGSAAKLTFAYASASLSAADSKALEKVAEAAKACGNAQIEVGGYTDNAGDAEANKALSEKRAKAVVAYLTKAGVDASKLKAVGYGQDNPVASNDTAEGRRTNRRIEFKVTSP